jgi:hypothetical protein
MINKEQILKDIVIHDKRISKLKNHISLKQFALKDFNKTNDKYKDYKVLFVNDFFNKFDIDIKEFLEDYLYNSIENEVYKKLSYGFYLDSGLNKDKLNKSTINQFKTLINSITYNINTNFIKELQEDLNQNQIRSLTILFYLKNYDRINNIMKDFFDDYLNNILED